MVEPRVVSLVPSATETLIAMGITPVACTRFCDQPRVQAVGGTKDPDVRAIVALRPDLVIVNDEENRREDADALAAAGVALHSMSPRSVAAVAPAIRDLAHRLGVREPAATFELPDRDAPQGRALILIWRRPWMSQSADTYGSSMLEHLGWTTAQSGPDRYPVVSDREITAAAPDLVVLPDEPYPFGPRHVPELAAIVPDARVVFVDGRDLLWWGTRTAGGLTRLRDALVRSHPDRG